MHAHMNQMAITGNLGSDPEVKTLDNGGRELVKLSVAVNEAYVQNGEKHERTTWIQVDVFNKAAKTLLKNYAAKGKTVCVSGKRKTRTYTDSNNVTQVAMTLQVDQFSGNVTILNSIGGQKSADQESLSSTEDMTLPQPAGDPGGGPNLDDDIPF